MNKIKNNKFILNQNILVIRELKNYINNYKTEDEEDIKDLFELINYKDSLVKGKEKLLERIQILEQEEKINGV